MQSFLCFRFMIQHEWTSAFCSVHPFSPPLTLPTSLHVVLSYITLLTCCCPPLEGDLTDKPQPPFTLWLNPGVGSSSLLRRLHFCSHCWAELAYLCELNVELTEHQLWELPSHFLLQFLSVSISHQTKGVLRCIGLGTSLLLFKASDIRPWIGRIWNVLESMPAESWTQIRPSNLNTPHLPI